jgi:MFS family permease
LFFLFIILVTPVASYFSRNHSIRFTIITGLAVAGITSSLFPYFTTLTQWSALRAGLGIGIGLYMVGGQVAINAFAIESQRTFVVGLHALSFGIGMGVGPLIGAWLFLIDAKLAFLFCGVILSIGIPVLIKWLPSITAEKINRINQKQVRSISISLHAVFAYGVAEATLLSLFPVFMIDRGYSVTIMGFTLSIFVIGGILSTLPLTKSADKVGQERVLAYCALFGVLGSLLLAWSPHISVLLLASLIAGASLGPIFELAMAIIGRKLSKQDLPSGSAFFTASFSLGAMCAPWLVAIIMKNFGSVHIFTLTSLLFASLLFRLLPTRRFA